MLLFSLVLAIGALSATGCANAARTAPDGTGSDAPPAQPGGRSGHGFVAGGVVAKSASYKLIGTLSSGQSTSASPHYTQHSGVLGSTQP
jgi:hypothetical protein